MTITYTGNLKLALPVSGTESGTWGDAVNQQLTTPVDLSISGTVSLTAMTNADYTLTNGDGNAANEARYMALLVPATLTLTAARNIIVPSTSKTYIVRNLTVGGFSVTVKTLSGTGVEVPNGRTMMLYCDSTNVIVAFDTINTVTQNGGQLAGMRNRIVNGAMLVNQRGAAGLTTGVGVFTYTLDRFYVIAAGAAVTVSRVSGINYGSNVTSVLQVTGAASNTSVAIGQRIEAANIQDLAGTTAAVSFWAFQSTGTTKTVGTTIYAPTATDNWTSQTTIGAFSTSVPSGVWTYCTGTIALTAAVQYGASLSIDFLALTGGQLLSVGAVQLERGPVATPFEYRPVGIEVELCQRYYAQTNQQYYPTSVGLGGIASVLVSLPVNMRTTPTVTNTFVDAQYTGPAAPSTGTQWSFAQPLLSYATKTGTVNVVSAASSNAAIFLNFQSATFTSASLLFTTVNNYIYVNAEL